MGPPANPPRQISLKNHHFLSEYVFWLQMPVKSKGQPRITKPVVNSRDSRASSTKKGALAKLPDLREEEEEQIEPEPPKPRSWLDTLPPVDKPDEELHIQLTKERRAALKEKHTQMCRRELYAMFNFAMHYREEMPTDRDLEHARLRFFNGEFHDKEIPQTTEEGEEPPQQSKRLSKKPGIKQLLDFGLTSVAESMLALSRDTSRERFEHDSNLEMDRLLMEVERGRRPYVSEQVPTSRVSCPFLICVTGPPGTGKSTVCQFIAKYFDVKVIQFGENHPGERYEDDGPVMISSREEKALIPRLIDEISKLPPGKGLILQGFPETKAQFVQLEKGLAAAAKKKPDIRFQAVSGVIRMTMTEAEVQEQADGRIVDIRTGTVYHKTFHPPIHVNELLRDDIVDVPVKEGFSATFQKVSKDMVAIDGVLKKTQVLSMPRFESVGECHLAVENFLRLLYSAQNIDVPFTSFVVFQTRQHFLYSKACAKLYDLWNGTCLPMFGKDLGDLYKRIEQAEMRTDYLRQNSVKTFELIISRPDDRIVKCRKFMENPSKEECGDLFHYVWQKSIDIRDSTLKEASEYCQKCTLQSLKGVMKEGEQSIFELILKRYFIVEWFTQHFAKIIDQGTLDEDLEVPEVVIPEFDVTNLRKLCELMNIREYSPPAAVSQSREELNPNPIELDKDTSIQNKTQEYIAAPNDSHERSGPICLASTKPVKQPFPSTITFEIRSEYAIDCGEGEEDEPPPPPPSNEETIRNFIDYVKSQATDNFTKQEATVMRNMFDFFLEKKKAIDTKVNQHIEELEKTLDALIRRKCSNEMEWFSEKIRKWKRGESFEGELFVYDTSFLDEECMDLYTRLQGEIPQEKEVPNIDPAKVEKLYFELKLFGSRFVSLTQILTKAEECGFTDKEQALVHVIAQVEALPEFIDLAPFCERLSPDLGELIQEEMRQPEGGSSLKGVIPGTLKMSRTMPLVIQSKIVDVEADHRAASACGTERKIDSEEPIEPSPLGPIEE